MKSFIGNLECHVFFIYMMNKGRHKLSAKCKQIIKYSLSLETWQTVRLVRLVSSITVLHINDLVKFKVKAAFMLC